MAKPIVALVGRPNVGKSTLFNRLIGERRAIVQNEPGTTRDRTYATAEWIGVEFTVVDTGGLMDDDEIKRAVPDSDEETRIAEETREQAYAAIAEADVIVFVTDIMSGQPTAGDYEIAELLRRSHKPVILALNKADSVNRRDLAFEFYQLGLGEPMAISAYHGNGTGDMLDKVVENLPHPDEEEDEELEGPKIAIVGRPNVGKSALLNALLGQERAIVSDVAGTTRDSLDTQLLWNDEPITLIDTAGIRRRGRVEQGIERVSVMRSMRSIERADVVVLVINAEEGFTTQDLHIAGYVEEQKKGLVVALNKWDLIEKDHTTMDTFRATAARELDFMAYAPVVFISAKMQQRVNQVLDTALDVLEQRQKRVSTAALNKMLREAVDKHQPPSRPGKWLKFYYATQADIEPPTFIFFTNDPKQIHFTYRRYLENELRKTFGFEGTPIRMSFRDRHEDF
ncbi:MAG: ribosome biogenesis GTPase Der [Thermomicrobiales bacterium]|nr:ribosome biogenesis GTPase Der [Thermomicrobiales bacterium]